MERRNPRCSIGPEDWIDVAIAALAEQGERGVSVESLARRLDVTKGSFYHHFADSDALWASVLDKFSQGSADLIDELLVLPNPRDRLSRLFAVAWAEPRLLRAERALLTSQRADVVAQLSATHHQRRAFLVRCYAELGLEPAQAAHHAATAYALFLGAVILSDQPPFDEATALQRWVDAVTPQLIP